MKSQKFPSQGSKTTPFPSALDDPHNVLLNEKQAAAFLGLTGRALQQRRYQSLPPVYIKLPQGSAIRYRLSALQEFIKDGEVPLP